MTARRRSNVFQLASGGITGLLLSLGWKFDVSSIVLFLLTVPGLSLATLAGQYQVIAELEEAAL